MQKSSRDNLPIIFSLIYMATKFTITCIADSQKQLQKTQIKSILVSNHLCCISNCLQTKNGTEIMAWYAFLIVGQTNKGILKNHDVKANLET